MCYDKHVKCMIGTYIKIGFFGVFDSDLRYQDEVHGALIDR